MKNQVKKLIAKLLLIIIPMLGILVGVNFFVDPGYYTTRSVNKFSNAIISGQDVRNYPLDLNFRKLHEAVIRDERFNAKVICVGSSRGWQLDRSLFPSTTFYNACVGSGNVSDYYAIYYLLKNENKLPDTLIISLDPWVVDNSRGEDRSANGMPGNTYYYRSLAKDLGIVKKYKLYTPKMLLAGYIHSNILDLLSFSYFQSSIGKIINGPRENYSMVRAGADTCRILHSDGSLEYPKSFNELTDDSVTSMAVSFGKEEFTKKPDVSEYNTHLLISFLDQLKKDHVTPVLFLSPYHPLSFDMINDSSQILTKDEVAIKEISRREGITCIGTYNPYACKFTGSDFYDYYHVKKKSIQLLYAHGVVELGQTKND